MNELVRYDAACRALSDAKTIDEAKDILDVAVAMAAYARQAKNRDLEADAVEIRMRATRRLDQLRQAQAATIGLNEGGRPKTGLSENPVSKPTLASQGIDKNLAQQARKLGALSDEKFERAVISTREAVSNDQLRVRGAFGTSENEWYTPVEYIDAARDVLGAIDLDPASSAVAQNTVKAERYFTKDDDGLNQEWRGRVWLNPPYAQPHIADFVAKMVAERREGNVTAAIMLTHNYTDTTWFHEAADCADAICFTRGRIRFIDANGGLAAPTQGQAFFYFGDEVERFIIRFAGVGFVRLPP